jgi:hypothetical protein
MKIPALLLFSSAIVAPGQEPPAVIDVHMHALPVTIFGAIGIKACPGQRGQNLACRRSAQHKNYRRRPRRLPEQRATRKVHGTQKRLSALFAEPRRTIAETKVSTNVTMRCAVLLATICKVQLQRGRACLP